MKATCPSVLLSPCLLWPQIQPSCTLRRSMAPAMPVASQCHLHCVPIQLTSSPIFTCKWFSHKWGVNQCQFFLAPPIYKCLEVVLKTWESLCESWTRFGFFLDSMSSSHSLPESWPECLLFNELNRCHVYQVTWLKTNGNERKIPFSGRFKPMADLCWCLVEINTIL